MTGWVAEDAIENIESNGGGSVTSDAGVTQYEWRYGLSYVWRTSSGQVVVVTFGQMTPEDAESAITLVKATDNSAFGEMLAENPPTPTTTVTAPDGP